MQRGLLSSFKIEILAPKFTLNLKKNSFDCLIHMFWINEWKDKKMSLYLDVKFFGKSFEDLNE